MNVTLQIKYYQLYVIVYIRIHQTRMHNFQIFPDKSYQKSKQNSFYIRIRIFRGKKLLDLPPSLDFHPTIYLLEEREDRIRVAPLPSTPLANFCSAVRNPRKVGEEFRFLLPREFCLPPPAPLFDMCG